MTIQNALPTRIIDSRHPSFASTTFDWEKWRLTYKGGDEFRQHYLERFNTREDVLDFELRKSLTPVPAFAKSAINDIRNSIFQRMRDITRVGGSEAYRMAVGGQKMGVDRRGSTMNAFLGMKVLPEILVMGRCGIYVDNSLVEGGNTIASTKDASPYLYPYQIEDILSWTNSCPDKPSEFQALLLRDTVVDYDRTLLLPIRSFQRFRLLWIDQATGKVNLQFYDMDGNKIDRNGDPAIEPTVLDLERIPFIMPDIGDSLIKDVCNHQIALLNLTSRDVWYALQANFPFYVEQRDMRKVGGHLKVDSAEDGTATTGGQGDADDNIQVGATHGRAYDKGVNPPGFIAPPSGPLEISIVLQKKYEEDIRKLVNLAVQAMASRSSAESKSLDNAGLESGLSYIGLILESTERQIAEYWAAYESRKISAREIATVKYPDRYSLKTDSDRIDEADKLSKLMFTVPGYEAKREIAKNIVTTLLGGKVDVGTIDSIHAEIARCDYLTSNPETIIAAVEAGLCGDETGSQALGFSKNEYKKAQADHLERTKRLMEAQSANKPPAPVNDPAARGVDDLAPDPTAGGKPEKQIASDPARQSNRQRPERGNAKGARVTGQQKKD